MFYAVIFVCLSFDSKGYDWWHFYWPLEYFISAELDKSYRTLVFMTLGFLLLLHLPKIIEYCALFNLRNHPNTQTYACITL